MDRYNRQFNCYYEGLQEELYCKHVSKKLSEFDRKITVKFNTQSKIKTLESSSTAVRKLVFADYDFEEERFFQYIKMCKKSDFYYSNLNFDLWLLLHKQSYNAIVTSNDAYVKLIRKQYNLESTADIKKEKNIERMLNQIELSDIQNAIINAKRIMNSKNQSDKIVHNNFVYYENPSMNIHEFFDELFCDIQKRCKVDLFAK